MAATRSPMSQQEPEERQIGIDPFSLRQLSRLDIDRPLPIPSVSVDDRHHVPAYSPARSASASVPCSGAASPRLSSVATAPTRWDAHLALAGLATSSSVADTTCPSRAASRSKSCADADGELELDDNESSPERRTSAPQRWGSDVPLIADARGKDGRRRGKHHGTQAAPFSCCLYLPGLTRRNKPPPPSRTAAAAVRSSSGFPLRGPAGGVQPEPESDDASMARQSAVSLAVSLERFECRFSTRSSGGLALDHDDEAASSSYFDLPLELILGCQDNDETGLPMHAAFMFDSHGIRKSVLKKAAKVSTDGSRTDRIPARHHARSSVTSRSADS